MTDPPLSEAIVRDQYRLRFREVLKREGIYLANHSLGRPPDEVRDTVMRAVSDWQSKLDDCWESDSWLGEIETFRGLIQGLIGAARADCVVPKTSAGQGLRTVLNAFPDAVHVVSTSGEFDSIDFILRTYESKGRAIVRWVDSTSSENGVPLFESGAVLDAITAETDLVVLSQVFFTTGQILEGIEEVVAKAHSFGAQVLVDVYHAIGVIPFDMMSLDIDYVIGGCYKYLRGGPGACYLGIHPRVADDPTIRTLDTGWFAKENTFGYERPDKPAHAQGGNGWLESTPPILTAYQSIPGIRFCKEVGIDRARAFNLHQQEALREAMLREGLAPFMPSCSSKFGAFTLVPSAQPEAVVKHLKDRGVTVDARGGFVRFGPDLLNTLEEFETAAKALAQK